MGWKCKEYYAHTHPLWAIMTSHFSVTQCGLFSMQPHAHTLPSLEMSALHRKTTVPTTVPFEPLVFVHSSVTTDFYSVIAYSCFASVVKLILHFFLKYGFNYGCVFPVVQSYCFVRFKFSFIYLCYVLQPSHFQKQTHCCV